jgi:hypothetical protein
MQVIRPLRPFFYKPVALLGIPFLYWKISLAATGLSAVFLFFFWRNAFGIPIWFVFSLGLGISLVLFFLWAHNSHKRGWLEYSIGYRWRAITGTGQNLLPEKVGRKHTKWLIDADSKTTAKPLWLE